LDEEEPIAEEELPAEERVEGRIGKARVSERVVEPEAATGHYWANERSPTIKRARVHHTEPAGRRLHGLKMLAYGSSWVLPDSHLPFKGWRKNRCRQ
jgi:hypothetical protein